MDHLLRDLAPIPSAVWPLIDDEARERLVPLLAARRVVDWQGPDGWEHSALRLGRTEALDGPPGTDGGAVRARRRRVQPLAEVRIPFTVSRAEIDDAERGARDLELDDLERATRQAAEIENRVVFHGWPDAGIVGIVDAAPDRQPKLGETTHDYPGVVAATVDRLRLAGVEGPYALAVGPDVYTRIIESTENTGYLLLDHLTKILGGTVVWTPGLDGAVVLSQRGDDFHLHVGQDLAIGYSHHDADTVHLYLEESFTFKVTEPDAAIAMTT
ncbi:MAG TPA: family 1 encapsulin nanocompartment shell protein [Pseudonocardia sp.]|nr:family 1 encapsulin nanocompartment shell protein [Pseudonocardia sp.]